MRRFNYRLWAILLRASTWRIAAVEAELTRRGWLRPLTGDEMPDGAHARNRDEIQRLGLVELTTAGQKEATRRLVVTAALARRQHGVMSGDVGRRRFLRHLQHTLGANAVFVAFASAARRRTECGGDEALEEWRSGAACARGRFRPDGYGCYRREGARFGFFLEFDRGTEKAREYAAKLDAYYRYRDSSAAQPTYAGFPALLVVTTSATAETRFAFQAYLAGHRSGGTTLTIFLTTTGHIEACPEGVLGQTGARPRTPGRLSRRGFAGCRGCPDRDASGCGGCCQSESIATDLRCHTVLRRTSTMLLYERLIGPSPQHPSLASIREDFAAAVPIVVNNVARFYFRRPLARISSRYLVSFSSLDAAVAALPGYHLHRPR